MKASVESEQRAIERLIAEIDSIDEWRDRIGRRVMWLFAGTFTVALSLLAWVAMFENPPARIEKPDGPQVPAVLHQAPERIPR